MYICYIYAMVSKHTFESSVHSINYFWFVMRLDYAWKSHLSFFWYLFASSLLQSFLTRSSRFLLISSLFFWCLQSESFKEEKSWKKWRYITGTNLMKTSGMESFNSEMEERKMEVRKVRRIRELFLPLFFHLFSLCQHANVVINIHEIMKVGLVKILSLSLSLGSSRREFLLISRRRKREEKKKKESKRKKKGR